MALDRRVRSAFQLSSIKADNLGPGAGIKDLNAGYTELKRVLASASQSFVTARKDLLSPELLVLGAEAAVSNEKFDVANEMIQSFFLLNPAQNQFYCRALFINALVEGEKGKVTEGLEKVNQLKHALTYIQEAFDIALTESKRPHYKFLVYNGSVHFWRVVHPLMREGARKFVIDSMKKVLEALDVIEYPDKTWRMQYLLAVALCCEDAGKYDECASYVVKAQQIAETLEPGAASAALLRMIKAQCVHISKHGGSCSQALSVAESSIKQNDESQKVALLLQKVRSGIIEESQVLFKLQSCYSELTKGVDLPGSRNGNGKGKTSGENKRVAKQLSEENLELVVDIGRTAYVHNHIQLARSCNDHGKNGRNRSAITSVKSDFLSACLMAQNNDSNGTLSLTNKPSDNQTPRKLDSRRLEAIRLSRRVEALKLMERALVACKRLPEPDLLQEGAIIAWNLALPLLIPRYRKYTHRIFNLCAENLEDLESPLVILRAQLHYEIAKCEADSDFLAKAIDHVDKACCLDYGNLAMQEEADALRLEQQQNTTPDTKTNGLDSDNTAVESDFEASTKSMVKVAFEDTVNLFKRRPIDRFLKPMKKKLVLKSSVLDEPETPLENAIITVEQSRVARDIHFRKTLLQRAADILIRSEDEPLVELTSVQLLEDEQRRAVVWADISKMSWELQMLDLALIAVANVLERKWSPEDFSEIVVLQATSNFIKGEVFVKRLRDLCEHAVSLLEEDDELDAQIFQLGINLGSEEYIEIKRSVISSFLAALQLGLDTKKAWVVENAVIYLWNHHIHIFKNGDGDISDGRYNNILPELTNALELAHTALDTIESKNTSLKCTICRAIADIYIESGKYSEAEELCKNSVGYGSVAETRKVVGMLACARVELGKVTGSSAVDGLESDEQKSLVFIAMLEGAIAQNERIKLMEKQERDSESNVPPKSNIDVNGVLDATIDLLKAIRDKRKLTSESKDEIAEAKCAEEVARRSALSLEDMQAEDTLVCELWAKAATCSLSLGQVNRAQFCARMAILMLPDTMDARNELPIAMFRWFSIAECVWARAIQGMIKEDTQEQSVQDALRGDAITHFVLASQWAVEAHSPTLALDAAQRFWSCSISLMSAPTTRCPLFESVQRFLNDLAQVGESSNMKLRVDLYNLLFTIYRDKKDWAAGLQACISAFVNVPPHMQKSLWEVRVLFMSKLGKNVQAGVARMKESDNGLMANLWATLARGSAQAPDQLSAYIAAIHAVDGDFKRVQYLVELGQWLIANHFPDEGANHLLAAVDVILEIEQTYQEEEDEVLSKVEESESQSRYSGTSSSIQGSVAGSRFGGGSQIRKPKSIASKTGTRRSTLSQKGSKRSGKSSSKLGSVKSGSKGSNSSTDAEEESNPTMLQVGHCETITRIMTMLSNIATSYSQQLDYALVAAQYVIKLWKISFEHANEVILAPAYELLEKEEQEAQPYNQWLSSQEKPFTCPDKPHEWLAWKLPPDVLRSWASSSANGSMAISNVSIPRPEATVYHLLSLCEILSNHGYHIYSIPIFELMNTIAIITNPKYIIAPYRVPPDSSKDENNITDEEADAQQKFKEEETNARAGEVLEPPQTLIHKLISLKYSLLREKLNLGGAAGIRLKIGSLTLTPEEMRVHSEALRQQNAIRKQAEEKKINEEKEEETETSSTRITKQNVKKRAVFESQLLRVPLSNNALAPRWIWTQQANELLSIGEIAQAKSLLAQAQKHNFAYSDNVNEQRCSCLQARCAEIEGDLQLALEILKKSADNIQRTTVSLWLDNILIRSRILSKLNEDSDAKELLENAVKQFEKSIRSPAPEAVTCTVGIDGDKLVSTKYTIVLSSLYAVALTETALAKIHVKQYQLNKTSDEVVAAEECAAAKRLFQRALSHFDKPERQHLVQIQIMLDFARALKILDSGNKHAQYDILDKAEATVKRILYSSSPTNVPSYVSLPASRILAQVKVYKGKMALTVANAALRKPKSRDPVQLWLEGGSTSSDSCAGKVDLASQALLHLSAAETLLLPVAALHARAATACGSAARVQCVQVDGLYGIWDSAVSVPIIASTSRVGTATSDVQHTENSEPLDIETTPDSQTDTEDSTFTEKLIRSIISMDKKRSVEEMSNPNGNGDDIIGPMSSRALTFIEHAVNKLWKGFSVAMEERDYDTAGIAALELAECCGSSLPEECAGFLSIYQSCIVRREMFDIFKTAATNKNRQKLFLGLWDHLNTNLLNCLKFPLAQKCIAFLEQQCTFWQRLDVSAPYVDMISELPDDLSCLMIQHTPAESNRKFGVLYISLLRNKNSGGCRVWRHIWTPEESSQLSTLVDDFSEYRSSLSKSLLQAVEETHSTGSSETKLGKVSKLSVEIDEKFKELLSKTELILAPIISKALDEIKSQQTKPNICLLVEHNLESLPWEGIKAMTDCSVSRDFSLAILYNRIKSENNSDKKFITDNNSFSYIADPRNEDVAEETNSSETIIKTLNSIKSSNWVGVTGIERIPSEGEWQRQLTSASGILFFGLGRCLSYFPPNVLAGLKCPQLKLVVLIDRAENDKSSRRQVKIDTQKPPNILALEQPYETAALFTMMGTSTIITNNWTNLTNENNVVCTNLFSSMISGKETVGDAIRSASKIIDDVPARVLYNTICYGCPTMKLM